MKGKLLSFILALFVSFSISSRDSLTLYIFLLDDCIICQSYTPKLNELYNGFGDGIPFIGVFPNFSSKQSKIDDFKSKYNIEFETKTDYWKTLTKKFGVTVTPEVVLYDNSRELILYRGRIDDEFVSLGRRRKVVTSNELENILLDVSLHSKGPFPFTEAIGCFINQNDPLK